jgi:hypothetical protein
MGAPPRAPCILQTVCPATAGEHGFSNRTGKRAKRHHRTEGSRLGQHVLCGLREPLSGAGQAARSVPAGGGLASAILFKKRLDLLSRELSAQGAPVRIKAVICSRQQIGLMGDASRTQSLIQRSCLLAGQESIA